MSKFGNLLLLPELGHMELHKPRLLLKLLWEPIISNIFHLLGFRAPRSKQDVQEGIDHHRSKQILSVYLDAISKELLMPFVRKCMWDQEKPTIQLYQQWLKTLNDQTFILLPHYVFIFVIVPPFQRK